MSRWAELIVEISYEEDEASIEEIEKMLLNTVHKIYGIHDGTVYVDTDEEEY